MKKWWLPLESTPKPFSSSPPLQSAKGLSLSLSLSQFHFPWKYFLLIIHPKNQNLSLFSFRKENPFLNFFIFLFFKSWSQIEQFGSGGRETQTRRSLHSQGMRPEFSDPNLNIMSLAYLGPISMSDAYGGARFGKELIERISSISKKTTTTTTHLKERMSISFLFFFLF